MEQTRRKTKYNSSKRLIFLSLTRHLSFILFLSFTPWEFDTLFFFITFVLFLIAVPPTAAAAPVASLELPTHVPYLLIGAGTSSFAAFRAIKSRDPKAKVRVNSAARVQTIRNGLISIGILCFFLCLYVTTDSGDWRGDAFALYEASAVERIVVQRRPWCWRKVAIQTMERQGAKVNSSFIIFFLNFPIWILLWW